MKGTTMTAQDYLNELGVTVHFVLLGETEKDDWPCDEWRATVERGNERFVESYFTGTGLRHTMPIAADLLYSLTIDADAAEMNFFEWCSNYCMNSDSIKSFMLYKQCCETAEKLKKVFKPYELAELHKLFQDY